MVGEMDLNTDTVGHSETPWEFQTFSSPWSIIQVKPDNYSRIRSPWCSEQLIRLTGSHHLAIHFLSYKQWWRSRRVMRRNSGVCERGQYLLWSRVSFLLLLSSHHPKDLPNRSIMLNEHGEEWQGLQPSVQNNTADGLDKHTCQGTSCFSLPIAQSQDSFSLPKVMILHMIRELPLSSFRIL